MLVSVCILCSVVGEFSAHLCRCLATIGVVLMWLWLCPRCFHQCFASLGASKNVGALTYAHEEAENARTPTLSSQAYVHVSVFVVFRPRVGVLCRTSGRLSKTAKPRHNERPYQGQMLNICM